jgi:hypothetical protein
MATDEPEPEAEAEETRFPDPGKPEGGKTGWVDWLLAGVCVVCALGAFIAVISMMGKDNTQRNTPAVVSGEYVAPRNVIRWTLDGGPMQVPTSLRSTAGACNPDLSFIAHGFTGGGQFAVSIQGNRLDSGWVGTVDELNNAVVTLNCFAYPQGDYVLRITDMATKKVTAFRIASERTSN